MTITHDRPAREKGAESLVPPRRADPRIDPRVADHGGTRTDPKSNYEFPGMVNAATWRRSQVHRHTRWYGCALCGQKFKMPHAVYTHLAKVHDR